MSAEGGTTTAVVNRTAVRMRRGHGFHRMLGVLDEPTCASANTKESGRLHGRVRRSVSPPKNSRGMVAVSTDLLSWQQCRWEPVIPPQIS